MAASCTARNRRIPFYPSTPNVGKCDKSAKHHGQHEAWYHGKREAWSDPEIVGEDKVGARHLTRSSSAFKAKEKVRVATKTIKLPPRITGGDADASGTYCWIPFERSGASMANRIGTGTGFHTQEKCEEAARHVANVRDKSLTPASYYIPHQVGVYIDGPTRLLVTVFRKGEMIVPT